MMRLIFGGSLAIILLLFYSYSIILAILATLCLRQTGCQAYTADLNEGILTSLNFVGGLVAALVIAELTITQPGEAPSARLLEKDGDGIKKKVTQIVAILYVLTWMVCGVAAVIVGYIQYPNVVPALTATAKSWFGLALAATYSYLGVKQG